MAIHQFVSKYVNGAFDNSFKNFAEGATFFVGSRSAQIMSDVWGTELYALYWDEESQSVKHAHLDTFEWSRANDGYGKASAIVDATEEVWHKVETYYSDEFYSKYESEALKEAQRIVKDSIVKVTGGRQNKGAQGKVAVVIERAYGMGYRSSIENKLGIAISDVIVDKKVGNKVYKNYRDIVWAWARNCELAVTPSIDIETVRRRAIFSAASKIAELRKTGSKAV